MKLHATREKPVTILIGIIGNDGSAVLASDSQTTRDGAQRLDANKIQVIQFVGAKAIVGWSGAVTLAALAAENLQKLATDKQITDYRTVADLAQISIRMVKDTLRVQNGDSTMVELRQFIKDYSLGFDLMIGHIFNGKPYIYTIDFIVGVANMVSGNFEAVGSARNLAEFLLSEMDIANMDGIDALAAATYVVEKAKKCDLYCGGPTKCCVIESMNNAEVVGQGLMDKLTRNLESVDAEVKKQRTEKVTAMLKAVASEYKDDANDLI